MVGGIGSCGRELCCTTFLPKFAPVSIKMAKHQNLAMAPTKVSGQCGRLKCCLVYEDATYVEAAAALPKIGKRVATPDGVGRVGDLDVLRGRVRVYFDGQPPKTFTADELQPAPPLPTLPAAPPRPERSGSCPASTSRRPIYYVNALPHLGTFYTTVVADALARYHRARAPARIPPDVFFLTGLDEHGQKIERIARERGLDPQAYCDEIAEQFQETWRASASPTTTSSARRSRGHQQAAAEMWGRLAARKGPDGLPDIYEAEYDGMYCVGCEETKTEDDVILDGERKLCRIHLTPVERVKEKNYFFRLSKYADRLLAWYDTRPPMQPGVAPQRGALVRQRRPARHLGLADDGQVGASPSRAIRRTPSTSGSTRSRTTSRCWAGRTRWRAARARARSGPASHHLIAKDILRFHAVYWPAMLMSAGPAAARTRDLLPRLPDREGPEDLQVDARHARRPQGHRRRAGRRSAALLRPARVHLRRRRRLHLRGAVPAPPVGSGQRPRQPAQPHAVDGAPLRRRRALAARADVRTSAASELLAATQTAWESFDPSGALEATWRLVRALNEKIDERSPGCCTRAESRLDCSTCSPAAARRCAGPRSWWRPRCRMRPAEILRQLGRRATKEAGRRRSVGRAARSPSRSRSSRASSRSGRPR